MTNMPIDFFRALRSAKISADEAQKVVESLEGHIAVKISEANASLVGELKSMRKDMGTLRWLQVTAISLSVIAGTIGGYAAAIIKGSKGASAPFFVRPLRSALTTPELPQGRPVAARDARRRTGARGAPCSA